MRVIKLIVMPVIGLEVKCVFVAPRPPGYVIIGEGVRENIVIDQRPGIL